MSLFSVAQTEIVGYEYWFNDAYEAREEIEITPTSDFSLQASFKTDGLSHGLHVFNIRFVDDNGVWSTVLTQFFYKVLNQSTLLPEIAAYEYWFNDDYENRVTAAANNETSYNLNTLASTNDLPHGLHTINIRVQDSDGVWSTVLSQFFYKVLNQSTLLPEIAAYEYWFNDDYENRVTAVANNQTSYNLNTLASTNELPNGLHTINIRVQDSDGVWSTVLTQFFYKVLDQSTLLPEIAAYEYWFNDDYENRVTASANNQTSYNLNTLASTNDLPNGLHTINIRMQDSDGVWSMVITRFFYKRAEDLIPVGENRIVGYRFWIYDVYETPTYVEISDPEQDFSLATDINLLHIQKGTYTVHFQFKDANNQWSVPTQDTIEKLSYPIATFSYSKDVACDSTVVTFMNESIDGDVFLWECESGMYSAEQHPSFVYYEPGNYEVILTITDTVTLVDSAVSKAFTIIGNTYANIDEIACDSYTSPSGLYTWHISGNYTDTIPNTMGCDSIISIALTINNSHKIFDTVHVCFGSHYQFPDGQVQENITDTETYSSHFYSVNNCDSIINTTVFVYPIFEEHVTVHVCYGSSFVFPDETVLEHVSVDTTQISILQSQHMCDSIVFTHISVLPAYSIELFDTTCISNPYMWRGQEYTQSGVYYDSLTTLHDCDSVYVLYLQVNDEYVFEEQARFCFGASFEWRGYNFTEQGIYYDSLQTAQGCDSVFVIELTMFEIDIDLDVQAHVLTAQETDAVYQWLDCNSSFTEIAGETNAEFTALQNGQYAVRIQKEQCERISQCYQVSVLSISHLQEQNIRVYPNPSHGIFSVDIPADETRVSIYTQTGALLFEQEYASGIQTIEVRHFVPGVYVMQIEKEGEFSVVVNLVIL